MAGCSKCRRTAVKAHGLCAACYGNAHRRGEIQTTLVDATPCQDRVIALVRDHGWTQLHIATAAGLSTSRINTLFHRTNPRIRPTAAAEIMALELVDHKDKPPTPAARQPERTQSFDPHPPTHRNMALITGNDGWDHDMVLGGVQDEELEDDPLAWKFDGLCASADPEAFFPEKGGSTKDAKAVCHRCPVEAICLEYALANEERFGIWGGKSERERRRILYERKGKHWPDSWKEVNG